MITIPEIDTVRSAYRAATPYPYVVIDNFLPVALAERLAATFPAFDDMATIFREPMSYKGQTSDIANKAPAFKMIFDDLQSEAFRQQIGYITGIDKLLDDAILAGGGLHQSPNSGFLDIHVDANYHPIDKSLHRRINLLIYLNKDWQEAWGGQFEIWTNRNHKPDQRAYVISPTFNRAVIFGTTRISWHGVGPIHCPPGQARKSLALYYYTKERPAEEMYADSSVIWHNRTVLWKRTVYPVMNFCIARLKPYAKYLRRNVFDAANK